MSTNKKRNTVLLVGAGPGDPELLTRKAYRVLQEADLVLADRLVPQPILDLIKCEIRTARKQCGKADAAQAELDAWGLDALQKGKRVVRLKNGDPFLYGRGGEEAVVYSNHGFNVEVVPGISSSLAGPLSAGIPATMRDIADQVLVCTGHGKHDRFPNLPEFCNHRTTIFLMAVGRLRGLCRSLQHEKGYPSTIPVAIVQSATMAQARTIRSTLACIADEAERQHVRPPGILVVGNVVNALTFLEHYEAAQTPSRPRDDRFLPKYQISYPPVQVVADEAVISHESMAAPSKLGKRRWWYTHDVILFLLGALLVGMCIIATSSVTVLGQVGV